MKQKLNSISESIPVLAWFLLVLLALTWGSSYILIKKALIAFSPQQLGGLRISLSFLAFLPVFFLNLKKVDWSKWKALATVGFCGSLIPAFLYPMAQTELSSSVTGVLGALTPLFTLVLGFLFFQFPVSKGKRLGVLIGFLGAIILVFTNGSSGEQNSIVYGLLAVLATFLYGLTNNVLKAELQQVSSVAISATSFMFIGIPGLIILYISDFASVMETHEHAWESFGYVCVLALLCTVFATLFYFKLIQLTSPIFGSMVNYLIPIVALSWGILDGEILVLVQIVGVLLILLGIYLSRK
jgi:drug/metabolite transporter (DMT)-like permease